MALVNQVAVPLLNAHLTQGASVEQGLVLRCPAARAVQYRENSTMTEMSL